jgi:hypothetical protein
MPKTHTNIFIIKHIQNAKNAPKFAKITIAKNNISVLTDILAGLSPMGIPDN